MVNDGIGNFNVSVFVGGINLSNVIVFGDLDGDGGFVVVGLDGLFNFGVSIVIGLVVINDSDVDIGVDLSFVLDVLVVGLIFVVDGFFEFDLSDLVYVYLVEGENLMVVVNYMVIDEFGVLD